MVSCLVEMWMFSKDITRLILLWGYLPIRTGTIKQEWAQVTPKISCIFSTWPQIPRQTLIYKYTNIPEIGAEYATQSGIVRAKRGTCRHLHPQLTFRLIADSRDFGRTLMSHGVF